MATGWENVGDLLGGGIDHQGAYDEGRLRTAQTEDALLRARGRQLDNVAAEAKARELENFKMQRAKMGLPDILDPIVAGGLGSDWNAAMSGLGTNQEMNFRNTLGDPMAPPEAQFAAGQAVKGEVLNPYANVGDAFVDLRAPVMPGAPAPLQMDPLAAAKVGTEEARQTLLGAQAGGPDYQTAGSGGAAGGMKPPSGYIANPNYDPSQPVGEGNYAFMDARQPVMGAREAVFFNRIVGGAKNAQQTLENIVGLPIGASAGLFGLGAKPGTSIWTAGVDALRNAVSSQTVQTYNTMIAGLDANLAQIEGHGLSTSDAFRGQYDRLALREGDTELTRLDKLAEMAQTIESGLDPYLSNPRIPQQQKEYMRTLLDKVRETIPFTHEDLRALEQNKAPTLKSLIQQKRLNAPVRAPSAPSAPSAPAGAVSSPGLPSRNDRGWELLEDGEGNLAYVSPDGTQIEEVHR